MLFGAGCGAPVDEPVPTSDEASNYGEPAAGGDIKRASAVYSVCWSALGVYSGPGTGYSLVTTLHAGSGNNFDVYNGPFSSNGDWWVGGWTTLGGTWGYVRWDGLCH
ncbi:hypothetical protein JY651_35605 [Pyxidicoccus parkwayensis]|uniref:Uncharacterized protein n=1 Tax=Pyxidicoccus parkwayensis TaxID=2813578 RepID=A0ABX7NSK8_9BACT|nr:hypothetical protein [Pyxidicoccus parkwaysis]QSQ20530.1 hypothetical protein JY651_35605 [Pyxidicoccus parkwaysis]